MTVCPVKKYANDVLAGKIVAGRLVRLACERHLKDLVDGPNRGLKWNPKKADRGIRFLETLSLPTGQPFKLQPFQKFKTGSLLGWEKEDGTRRFQTGYIEEGKGSGKTPWAGGMMLYGAVADGERAAECYACAVTREQSGICFRDVRIMAESSALLKVHLDIGLHNIAHLASNSFIRALSSEGRSLDGKRPHFAVLDEIHEHPSAVVVDKIKAGRKSRRQPLFIEITNSGSSRETVCWAHHDYSAKVLEGVLQDDTWFAYVCQLDPCEQCRAEGQLQPADGCKDCDQWTDEKVWPKANPGLDTILPRSYLRQQVREAQGMPTQEGIVKRLNFCIWTAGLTRAIPMDAWDRSNSKELLESFEGRACFCGLDIGATSDFTAFAMLFPGDEEEEIEVEDAKPGQEAGTKRIVRRSYTMIERLWLPESPVRRDQKTQEIIDGWRKRGHVITTPGNTADYDLIVRDIEALSEKYAFQKIALDRGFQGAAFATALADVFGEEMVVAFPQGILSMNLPFRELLELLKMGKWAHFCNPCTRWQASNCVSETKGGLIKPSKEESAEKIDVITAAVMALGPAMAAPTISAYGMETW